MALLVALKGEKGSGRRAPFGSDCRGKGEPQGAVARAGFRTASHPTQGMSAAWFFGVDGCPAGWFSIGLSDAAAPVFGIARNTDELVALVETAQLVLIDIPIGLRENGSEERLCDKEARRVLGRPRGSSVFPAPVRPVLGARDYPEACDRSFAVTGKRLSQQAYRICGKIGEVDGLLRRRPELRRVMREMHPEVAFWALNGGQPTAHSKKRPAGRQERLEILSRYLPGADDIFTEAAQRFSRRDVGRDDILDAMVGAATGWIARGRLRTLPAAPPRDAAGLPMEMVYCPR